MYPCFKNLLLVTLSITVCVLAGCAAPMQSPSSIVAACHLPSASVLQSIVRIESGDNSTASGVIIDTNTVLTAAHALETGQPVWAYMGERGWPAKITLIDHQLDLALLQVNTEQLAPLPLNKSPLASKERLWAIGFPLSLDQKVSLGYYQKMTNNRLYTSNHVNSGVSGGGLLRCTHGKFELAGIIHGYVGIIQDQSVINIGDSTSIPVAAIIDFLQQSSVRPPLHLSARL